MRFTADLHIHSHFSRATSKSLNFEQLTRWAQLKGIHVIGTGDVSHPGWLAEIKQKLDPAEEGLFQLKPELARAVEDEVFPVCRNPVRFLLAGEISNIYKKNGKVRKVHHVVFMPSLLAAEKFQASLEKIGNIRSDGRPILGLSSHDLLETVLETDPQACLIPAHVWTPWFALFGSKSGYDDIEECFEDLTPHIFALETGLSSDPPMNWRVPAIDQYTLVSNSDAHSPEKLAREANLFDTELSYPAIFEALRANDGKTFLGTIEFFPEEGKYHLDGHRKCGVRWKPAMTLEHNGLCSACGRPVTVGVMHRVELLAGRPESEYPSDRQPFHSLIPLPEVLGEIYQVGPASKRVRQAYMQLLAEFGPELTILRQTNIEDLERSGGKLLAEAIARMRQGHVRLDAGYDGEFGVIKLFDEAERHALANPGQLDLFE
ncbi:DNA helicase UvrD [Candidatus Sumerlaeota bacterium]|nr:DNA helicase UvrD [Candidatus Sumerlaeota bacterium]